MKKTYEEMLLELERANEYNLTSDQLIGLAQLIILDWDTTKYIDECIRANEAQSQPTPKMFVQQIANGIRHPQIITYTTSLTDIVDVTDEFGHANDIVKLFNSEGRLVAMAVWPFGCNQYKYYRFGPDMSESTCEMYHIHS